jgi:hypothetical protein
MRVMGEKMFLLARYTVAAAVFLSASAASAVEDENLSADQVLPACAAFIADRAPREIDGVFQAGLRIGLMQGLGFASRLLGVCPPDEVTPALRARVAVHTSKRIPSGCTKIFERLRSRPCRRLGRASDGNLDRLLINAQIASPAISGP